MYLGDPVPGHGRDGSFHVEVCEEGWGTYFSGMVEAVGADKGAAVRGKTIFVVLGGGSSR